MIIKNILKKNNPINFKDLELFYDQTKDLILRTLYAAQSGHIGGAISSLHYLSYLAHSGYIDLKNDFDNNNNPLIISPGHYCPSLYALMIQCNVIKKSALDNYRTNECKLHGHPIRSLDEKVFYTSGSLGQGLSLGIGVSLGSPKSRVHVLLSDGELNEGQIWEALMFISSNKINNIKIAIDLNGVQLDGFTSDILNIGSIKNKLIAFGFQVIECNGNSFKSINKAYQKLSKTPKPSVLILNTKIAYGIEGLEGLPKAHGCKITDELMSSNSLN